VHGEHGWTVEDPMGRNGRRRLVRRILSRVVLREITCVSKQMERWLRTEVRASGPVTQIYNGVDTQTYRPRADAGRVRRELGVPSDAFVVVCCGRLDPIKDHATLIRAFGAIDPRAGGAHLWIVGDGPERVHLDAMAGENVRFLGDRSDVPELLAESDAFALTSLNEGISNTILEAMSSGLPVVATAVGGNGELVDDGVTGVLVRAGAVEEVRGALDRYRRQPEIRREHGCRGRRSVEERFTVERMVERYEEVWRRIAGTARARDLRA